MSTIKRNFIFNIALTLSTYIINIVIFPYVSRSLGVELVGKIGFVTNFINYFSLFALLGIGTVGIREIATCGQDKIKRSKVFSELIFLTMMLTIIVLLCYIIVICNVPQLYKNINLLIIGISNIFFTSLLIEWFYQGLENFAYITIRTVLVKIIYAISVLLLIKNPDDYFIYFCLTASMIVVNAMINLFQTRKYVKISFNGLEFKKYLKPVISLGLYRIMVSMYTTFNIIYLGFVCSEKEVGFYYTSTKVFYIILGIFTAFTSVMLPRMSSLIAAGKKEEFRKRISDSFDLVFACALPLVVFCTILAPQIIYILSGRGFEGAILPMRMIMPTLLVTGLAQIYIIQVLTPLRKDKVLLFGSFVGACIGIIANVLLVKCYGAIGSALVLLFSEISGSSISFIYTTKNRLISFPLKKFLISLFLSIPYILCCLAGIICFKSPIYSFIISGLLCAVMFLVVNIFLMKETILSKYICSKINYKK